MTAVVERERGPAKPAILTVDDDAGVSRAVARDLRRRYGQDYRILRADSGPDALDVARAAYELADLARLMRLRTIERRVGGLSAVQRALAELRRGPATLSALAGRLGVSRQALHYHVKRMISEGKVRAEGEVLAAA